MSDKSTKRGAELAYEILRRYVETGDVASDLMTRILDEGGHEWMFRTMCAWAGILVERGMPRAKVGTAELKFAHGDELCEPEDLPREAAGDVWACRVIAAAANEDEVSLLALYMAAVPDPKLLGSGMRALLHMTSNVVKANRRTRWWQK